MMRLKPYGIHSEGGFKSLGRAITSRLLVGAVLHAIRCVALLFVTAAAANAQESRKEFWPEFNAYLKINDTYRLRFLTSATRAQETGKNTEATFEADLDIGLEPYFRQKILGNLPDAHRGKYLTFRIGYAFIPSFADENPDREHRIVMEATPRYLLPLEILVSDRNRGDLRWINGEFSSRYRNRLRVERDFAIRRFKFTPYAAVEAFYDTRVDVWNRTEFSIGQETPLGRHAVIEFYYLRQNNSKSNTQHVNGFGIVFQLHY